MSPLPPFSVTSDGAVATLEHTALRTWFASLGEARPAAHDSEPAPAETRPTNAACPHPERCRFGGCERDCSSPLPAA